MAGMQSMQTGQNGGVVEMGYAIPSGRVRLVKELKGASISVLRVLIFSGGGPVTK